MNETTMVYLFAALWFSFAGIVLYFLWKKDKKSFDSRYDNVKKNVLGTRLQELRDEEARKWYLQTGRTR